MKIPGGLKTFLKNWKEVFEQALDRKTSHKIRMFVSPLATMASSLPAIEHAPTCCDCVLRAKRAHPFAYEEPCEPAWPAIVRDIEKITRRPAKGFGKAPPFIEEPTGRIDRLPPLKLGDSCRSLTLEASPSIKVGLRHATQI
jgi:hypothetical protein